MPLDKRSCMARAEALLSDPTSANLRYAALELRLCIEALTYEKLCSFATIIPESVLNTWQPPQAVKALLEFEPDADQSFYIRIGQQGALGQPAPQMRFVGQHNSLRLQWLRKHYNKLGNLLHAPSVQGSSSPNADNLTKYLAGVVADLRPPLASSILGGSIRSVYSFTCSECGSPVVCNARVAAASHKAVCFNPQCKAEYYATVSPEGQPTFDLMATSFECTGTDCAGTMRMENRKLNIGVELQCPVCALKHVIVELQWGYGPKEG
jgi:hypothetical protein